MASSICSRLPDGPSNGTVEACARQASSGNLRRFADGGRAKRYLIAQRTAGGDIYPAIPRSSAARCACELGEAQ